MWYAKMYFSEGKEIFQYDAAGTQGVPSVQKEFPFLESLLSFQELDCSELTPMLQYITDNWSKLVAEGDMDINHPSALRAARQHRRQVRFARDRRSVPVFQISGRVVMAFIPNGVH